VLAVSLLGSFQITKSEQAITDFRYDKVRALLAYLMVEQQLVHHRDFLTSLLWPEQNEKKARHSLRQALSTLRRALGDDEGELPTLIASRSTVQVNPASTAWLDVQEFEKLLAECEAHEHTDDKTCAVCMEKRRKSIEIYQGDFLKSIVVEDCPEFENWIWWKRERLSRLAIDNLTYLAQYHERRDELTLACHYVQYQLELEPWREEAHRQLMGILARTGQRSAALVQYKTCSRILQAELDVEPDQKTQKLYEKIRRGPDVLPSNVPAYPSEFINRHEELATISLMLAEPSQRLITLVGPSGIGKTRLSLRVAESKQHSFLDGTYFVRLDTIHHADEAWKAIADVVGFQSKAQTQKAFVRGLVNYLQQREVLLILDNFEQVQEGEGVITTLLQDVTELKLIVTSCRCLNSPWESILELDGLAVPPHINHISELDAPERYCSIELFVEIAKRSQHNFEFKQLSDEEQLAIVKICQLVGGLPLAIELAASWSRVAPFTQILQEISKDLAFLQTDSNYYPERHRNVHQIFEKVWETLTQSQQQLLQNLVHIFPRETFTLAKIKEHQFEVSIQTLAQLVDQCLIRSNQQGEYVIHELLCCYIFNKFGSELKMVGCPENTQAEKGANYRGLSKPDPQIYTRKSNNYTMPIVELTAPSMAAL